MSSRGCPRMAGRKGQTIPIFVTMHELVGSQKYLYSEHVSLSITLSTRRTPIIHHEKVSSIRRHSPDKVIAYAAIAWALLAATGRSDGGHYNSHIVKGQWISIEWALLAATGRSDGDHYNSHIVKGQWISTLRDGAFSHDRALDGSSS